MVRAHFDLDGAIRDLSDAVEQAIHGAVAEHAARISDAARAEHAYTDRTGRLTASLRSYAARRAGDLVVAEVVADTEYAEFVERRARFAYLAPAHDRVAPYFEQDAEQRMTDAARGAGW